MTNQDGKENLVLTAPDTGYFDFSIRQDDNRKVSDFTGGDILGDFVSSSAKVYDIEYSLNQNIYGSNNQRHPSVSITLAALSPGSAH